MIEISIRKSEIDLGMFNVVTSTAATRTKGGWKTVRSRLP